MKVGRDPARDLERVRVAREAIGPSTELYVDANGALSRMQALWFAHRYADEFGVSWFEEPVSSDDLEGLRLLRDRAPAGMDIAAGEYGYSSRTSSRCSPPAPSRACRPTSRGVRGSRAFCVSRRCVRRGSLELSAHCGPSVHAHPCCAVPAFRHLEYFHDHARLEPMLFDGVLEPRDGALHPDLSRPGNGLELKRADAARYAV